MEKPYISYVPLEEMDERMQEEMHRCAREGTPRPESSAGCADDCARTCAGPAFGDLADRVALVAGGRVLAVGTHQELLADVPHYREVLASTVTADDVPETADIAAIS